MRVFFALSLIIFGLPGFPACARADGVILTTLASFAGTNGSDPWASVVEASDGNFYGTTYAGGASDHFYNDNQSAGTVFRVTPDGVLTCLASFLGPNGSHPRGALIEGSDGNLYGTTQEGGDCPDYGPFGSQISSPGLGTIFRLTKDGALTILLSFWGTNGSLPATALVKSPAGTMYGTTRYGGSNGNGTIFSITTNGDFALTHSFGPADTGGSPIAPLILGSDGIFYGNMIGGGTWGQGIVFTMSPSGMVTKVADLNDANAVSQLAALCESRDDFLYGVSEVGGAFRNGAVWRMSKQGIQTTVCSFPTAGDVPFGGVIEGTDGNFYGTRPSDQTHPYGLVYCVSPAGDYQVVSSFNLTNGAAPEATLIQSRDGNLYGTTAGGGVYRDTNGLTFGTIFRLSVPSAAAPKLKPPVKAGNGMNLTWSSIAGRTYQVQYRTNLQDQWHDLGINVTATNKIAAASDENAPATQRFYRAVLMP